MLRLVVCGCCFFFSFVCGSEVPRFFSFVAVVFLWLLFFGCHGVLCTAKFVSRLESGVLFFGATLRDSAAVIAPCP